MAVIYGISDFNYSQAKQGTLCAVVKENYEGNTISSDSASFGGVGIARYGSNSKFAIIINGITYMFNNDGTAYNSDAKTWCLVLAQYLNNTSEETSSTPTEGEYSEEPGTESETEPSGDSTADVEFRNKVALEVLGKFLMRMDKLPYDLSDGEKMWYCCEAYTWADNMIRAARTN